MILLSENWFLELEGYLTSKVGRFKQSEVNNVLFVRTEADEGCTKMLVYINDSLYSNTKNNKEMIKQLEKEIKAQFDIELQGHAHCFLLMRITTDKYGNYTLDQSRDTKNIERQHLGNTEEGSIKRALPKGWVPTKKNTAKD